MAFRSLSLSPRLGKKILLNYLRVEGGNSAGVKQTRVMSMRSGDGSDGKNQRNDTGPSHWTNPPSAAGYQGGDHEFTHNHSLEVLSAAVDYHYVARKSSSVDNSSATQENHAKEYGSEHCETEGGSQEYDNSGHVSLSSCMQSNVPEPFSPPGRSPVHLNMPQGGSSSDQKYVANKLESVHPSRQFSTSARSYLPTLKAQPQFGDYESEPCPQGIQGDDCVQFKLWLESCRRYGLANCEDQLQGIQTGRKTLAQVLQEQDELIRKIAEEYRKANGSNIVEFDELDLAGPSPQGIQGEDCERFRLWFRNCQQFGFGDCAEHLQGIQGGRKTLSQIFKEQDDLIQGITQKYYSTSADQRD